MTSPKRETFINTRTHCMDLANQSKAVQSLDINGQIIDVSPAWLELTGYDKDEAIGRHFMEFLYPDSLSCVKKNFPNLKDFGYVDNVQLKVRTKANRALSVTLNGTSKYDEQGEFERTFCELSLNAVLEDGFKKDMDEFLEDMEDYLTKLGDLLNQKIEGVQKLLRRA
ncbi:PAS domain-containing protein [Vibrio hannami]|uniref:PAS domain-containing protein n=1 Tax=Vibrio hannami TaxID=2717094 RepID=UPI002410250B|nr:PAS domain-containing protein [Vibrio hannami]MDG3087587.1 PAS domain-containing protein [Vibrio hannami]